MWRRIEHVKRKDKITNKAVLGRMGKGQIMLNSMKKRKRNWLSYWLKRHCLLNDALEGMVNGRAYQMMDNIKINGS